MHDLDSVGVIIRDGFYHIKPLQGAIVAILFGLLATSVGSVFVAPLLGAIVYIAIDAAMPVIMDHAALAMPVMDTAFWHFFITLYVVFLVAAALIFALRNLVWNLQGWRTVP